ncbi:MAG: PQQ-binding-like beta-propeller repeat protein [Azospirillaceae bacterium]
MIRIGTGGHGVWPAARRLVVGASMIGLVTACSALEDIYFGAEEEIPLPGERISVLDTGAGITADPGAASQPVVLDPASSGDWPVAGGNPQQSPGNPAFSQPPEEAWSTSVGDGASSRTRLLNPPVVAGGRIYVADAGGRVTAIDAGSGSRVWRVRIASPDENSTPIGGGVAYGNGVLYATTGFGEVVALDPGNGGLIWRSRMDAPIRSAPMVAGDRVYAISVENQLTAFDAVTGETIWSHNGLLESAGLLGGAAPSVTTGAVVAPYSSGEVYAILPETGRALWSDSLSSLSRNQSLTTLSDIRGGVVIDDGRVYAASNGGRTAAIDLRTGSRSWEQGISSAYAPLVSGNTVFVLTLDFQMVALDRATGGVRWVQQLQRFRNQEDRLGQIAWGAPVLAGGQIVVFNSEEQALIVSPTSGEVVGSFGTSDVVDITPVVAGSTMYVLSQDGYLTAYR